ncbi:NAD(P)-binding protein [Arthrobacter sp. APC 3897]|uniref:oxidoreductase n=1 Tax=Arthrobacter sp. APC 3897 TaxID=3035204 RepID=UPI0025B3A37D|nr:NAD(P)/FAD-dependent oxidoreductase [Arthrobacter sp. APC 3897]MDN3482720.1 NAD(P)-binding protein [Arthrobacter sp. APC 3897]
MTAAPEKNRTDGDSAPKAGDPVRIRGLILRNRLTATAHGLAAVRDGEPLEGDAEYWARLSRGGASMLVAGATQVAKESLLRQRYLTEAFRRETLPGLRRRAVAMKSGGAVAALQLGHLGRETLGANTSYAFVSPSAVKSPREQTPVRVLRTEEISDLVNAFKVSARNAYEAGFDVVELHGAHGYLIANFLNRLVNTRSDRFGGGAGQRILFVQQIIEAIRGVSGDAPLGLRVSVEGGSESGLAMDDLCELLQVLQDRAPVDYINLSYGVRGHYVPDMATEVPRLVPDSGSLRSVLDVPLIVSSAFRNSASIDQALSSRSADLIGMARAHIADPDFVAKMLGGRESEIRPCVACNEDCRAFDPTALCTVNPALAPQGETLRPASPIVLRLGPTRVSPRLAVVGAGPAGLECAITAAAGGAEVVLFEGADRIGGQLLTAAAGPNRSGWLNLLEFYESSLLRGRVNVKLGVRADSASLEGFTDVVLALGAREEVGPVPEGGTVCTSSQWLHGKHGSGRIGNIVIVDDGFGWWTLVSSIEAAIARGAERISVVTPAAGFAGGIPAESRMQFQARLQGVPLHIIPFTELEGAPAGAAVVRHIYSGESTRLNANIVVTVGLRVPQTLAVAGRDSSVRIVGDAVIPRRVSHAVSEGRRAGLDVLAAAKTP